MQGRGLIIRFIDVGLLLLFGFLMISDIKGTSQISFNEGSTQDFLATSDSETVLLGVAIESGNRLSIRDIKSEEVLHENILSLEELEFLLETMKKGFEEEGTEMNVLIEPASDAHIQYVVHVLDVCDRLELVKNINTEFGNTSNEL